MLITHSPNIAAAFPKLEPAIRQGEVLVFNPDEAVGVPVARIQIEQWSEF
ncbi:MAG: hypothetical protein OXE78_02130 [Gammaproteobacteria bacterium]|nr:hypothetical protein [Gammaproteobacteria bacterium]